MKKESSLPWFHRYLFFPGHILAKPVKPGIRHQISINPAITSFKVLYLYQISSNYLFLISMKQFSVRLFIGCSILFLYPENANAQHKRELIIDATLHYVLSAEITFASCMFVTLKNPEISLKSKYLISSGVGLFAGVAKELTDLLQPEGYFDWIDIGVDIIGIGTGLLLHYCIFDKKMIKSNISLGISNSQYMASIRIYLK